MLEEKVSFSEEKIYTRLYRDFKGVDLTSAVTEVDSKRSPYAPNMIADLAGFPQRRPGYDKIHAGALNGRINGVYPFVTSAGVKKMIVHAGTKIYAFDGSVTPPPLPVSLPYAVLMPEDATPTEIYSGAKNARSTAFAKNGKLYILDGENFIAYNGTTAADVETGAYVPTTAISMAPTGGGEDHEPVNLLQPKRINSFLGTAGTTVYQLDAENITSVDKCEKKDGSGNWVEITSYAPNLTDGKVTFTTAPGEPPVTGEDNVRITFSKVVAGYADRIKKCTINTQYGINNDLRAFVSGNPDYRNYDWYSDKNGRADYFPDVNYGAIGEEGGAVMGYLKQYDDLVIVKQPNGQDASIFMRSATLGSDGDTIFTVEQGLAGAGAISKYCFSALMDDSLFLSKEGVIGLDSSSITQQKTTQLRSYYINAELTKEAALYEAAACVANGYYYLCINDHVYIADSRQKNGNASESYGYEWYYWLNVPARCICEYEGFLYIGDPDGYVHKFKTEIANGMEAYSDNGAAIPAAWATKMDDLDNSTAYKKIQKSGTGVKFMPFGKSSGKIYFVTDSGENEVKEFLMSTVFDFDNIDFDNMDFGVSPYPAIVPARKQMNKIKFLQVRVENGEANEGFGLYEMKVNYKYGNDIKR
jgi:hypothetical protein